MAQPTALGVLEARGMATVAAATDAMLKVADVTICGRHGIGSGWVTITIEGDVAAVDAAIRVGEQESRRVGELITAHVIPRPGPEAMAHMPHSTLPRSSPAGPDALGLLETQGLAQLIVGADAMVKVADVQLVGWAYIGGALCHVMIRGETSAVQAAVEAGRDAAQPTGPVYATLVIPQPADGLGALLPPEPTAHASRIGALGVVETTGYVGCVAGADAMVKAANVEIERLSIGSGGRIAALVTGDLDSVRSAVEDGASSAQSVAEVNASCLISRPDEQVVRCFGGRDADSQALPQRAIGLIETRTTAGLVKAVDEMLKTANVDYEGRHKVGYFLTAAVIRGDVDAVKMALDVGAEHAAALGELVAVHAIAYPYPELEARLPHE